MLRLEVVLSESYDEEKKEFIPSEVCVLELEHSLISLSKWESEFEKPFLSTDDKSEEETRAYIAYMIITPDYPPDILDKLSEHNAKQIQDYISRKMTATWFSDSNKPTGPQKVITAERIYFWMLSGGIPWEAQYWHINRLFTLIRVIDAENNKDNNKVSPADAAANRRKLNAERKKKLGTRG